MSDYSSIFVPSHCVSKTQLLSYIRQKLDKEEMYLVESHLNDCQFCNDALDAYLETENFELLEKDLLEVKTELTKQLFPKIDHLSKSVNGNIRKSENSKNNFSRWLAAASVLLLIGLGGYTVFSYIQSHNKELAINKKSKNLPSYDAEYSKPEGENGEIVRLNVDGNDTTFKRYGEEELKENRSGHTASAPAMTATTDKEAFKPLDYANNESKDAVTEEAVPPVKIQAGKVADEKVPATPVQAPQTAATDNLRIDPAPGMENYARTNRDEKIQGEVSKEVAKKKSVAGMKYDNNMQSNQMNYPRGNNNDFAQQRGSEVSVQQKQESNNDVSEPEMTHFEKGMENFNNKNYRRSISYFEKALKKAGEKEREDIMYHLALAYEYTGKTGKAYDLYVSLSKSKKYSKNAERKLKEAEMERAQRTK